MLRYLLIFIIVFLASGLVNATELPGPRYPPTKGGLWPKAQSQTNSPEYYTFNAAQFTVKVVKETCDILTRAIDRYSFIIRNTNRVNGRCPNPEAAVPAGFYQGDLKDLDVELTKPCGDDDFPYFNMDEQYNLVISAKSKLSSDSLWGILRGLETFAQLFYLSDDYKSVYINATEVTDYPRYPHRGLLLDTSRHYISMANILKMLDALTMNKMNVFHWHIVDDQSFPYQSEKFPELSAKGAYYPTMIYTKSDIKKVVEYARDRGIRVIPEFDVPGHTRSWGVAYPELLTECYDADGTQSGLGPMDPSKDNTYSMLGDLILELQAWFPDKYFHVGGDEVEQSCWNSNPTVKKFMQKHNMSSTAQLHGYFMKKVIPLLGDSSKAIVWQEVFDEGVHLDKDIIIQVWKYEWIPEMIKILKSGHKVLYSSSWYLDQLNIGGDWEDFFTADPRQMIAGVVDYNLLQNIVGGEACMWGEVVDDTNVVTRTWPRASAVAERLWSPELVPGPQNSMPLHDLQRSRRYVPDEARHRLEEHACRMRRRGVRAQPPNGPGVCVGAVDTW